MSKPTYKPENPKEFKGDRGRDARKFVSDCEFFFKGYGIGSGEPFETHEARARLALRCMGGEAYAWAQPYNAIIYDGVVVGTNDPHKKGIDNWDTFKKDFLSQWSSTDVEREAEHKISKLVYGSSIATFVAEFRELASQTKWNDQAKTAALEARLPQWLKAIVALQVEPPSSLHKWYDWIIKMGERQEELRRTNPGSGSGGYSPARTPGPSARGGRGRGRGQWSWRGGGRPPAPTGGGQPNGRPTLPKEEMERLSRENRCYRCKQVGHISRNCPLGGQTGSGTYGRPGGPPNTVPKAVAGATSNAQGENQGNGETYPGHQEEEGEWIRMSGALRPWNDHGRTWREAEDVLPGKGQA